LAKQEKTRRLARLAAPLKPEKSPYYVRLPVAPGLQDAFPATGWYWIPHGHDRVVFLGASEIDAARVLDRLIERELAQP
jgi:hypothetical protein